MNGILKLLFTWYFLENWRPGADFVTYAHNRRDCSVAFNSARIAIPPHIPSEQPDADTVLYGANAYGSNARIAVLIN